VTWPAIAPTRLERDEPQPVWVKPQKVEVVIPPLPKFQVIKESDEYQPSSSPVAPRQAKPSKLYGRVIKILVFVSACERCNRGKRDCVVDELGALCMGCKAHKYRCSHTGKKDLKTMVVTRSVDDSEEGRKRRKRWRRRREKSERLSLLLGLRRW